MSKSNNPTYHLTIEPQGDHLQVSILELPELGILETQPGHTRDDDALDVAHKAIIEWNLTHRERKAVKAS